MYSPQSVMKPTYTWFKNPVTLTTREKIRCWFSCIFFFFSFYDQQKVVAAATLTELRIRTKPQHTSAAGFDCCSPCAGQNGSWLLEFGDGKYVQWGPAHHVSACQAKPHCQPSPEFNVWISFIVKRDNILSKRCVFVCLWSKQQK